MANYKLVNSDQLDTDMKTVADKIREKAQLSGLLNWPSGYIEGIDQCSSLNFSVVGGTTRPNNPVENTIWVKTDTEITRWALSPVQPQSPANGAVWIKTGSASEYSFNALKKNEIKVYPQGAKQYVARKWVDIDCLYYQNGKWNEGVSTAFVFQNGAFTKGSLDSYASNNSSGARIEDGAIGLFVQDSGAVVFGWATEKFDLSDYSKIVFVVKRMQYTTTAGSAFFDVSSTEDSRDPAASTSARISNSSSPSEHVVDISSLNGSYYVRAAIEQGGSGNSSLSISEIRLES